MAVCMQISAATPSQEPDSTEKVTMLQEITVKRKKEKYSKKNNPAVDFVNRLRRLGPDNDPLAMPAYSYSKYEKTVLGSFLSDDADPDSTLRQFMDYSSVTGRRYITLSLKEKISKLLHTSSPESVAEVVGGYRTMGIDESLDAENMRRVLDDVLREINVYSNDITLLQQRFVSPLSSIGPDFYKYYLTDTIAIGGEPCIELVFGPHNRESLGFSGRIYVPLGDTTMFVKKIVMQTPKAANLNFVNALYLVQNFTKDSLGNRHKISEQLTVDIGLSKGHPLIYARKELTNSDFAYSIPDNYEKYLREGGFFFDAEAWHRTDEYWDSQRLRPLTLAQQSMPLLMPALRRKKWFFWGEKFIALMERGYLRTSRNSKFDIGPLNTLVSYNDAEGVRLRVGGMTTANLFPHLYARGYGAYGFSDHKWKYQGLLEYSFNDKKYHAREFPMHLLRMQYGYDVDRIGQHYLFTNPDNMFLSLSRKKSTLVTYRRLAEITYVIERKSGFSVEASMRWERQYATRWLPFVTAEGRTMPHYTQSAVRVALRYAPGEEFYQSASMRMPINMDAPVIQLTQEWGPSKFLGSDFPIVKTEISAMKRIWFSAFGYMDAIFKGAKIWSSVYYPALTWANANLSYTIQPESYSLMNPMEFATDQYLALDLTYWGMGVLFNRLPWIKKAKLREVVTFKGYYGSLTDRNNPQMHSDLPVFPTDALAQTMNSGPYMELGAGIDNIFKILRVDYIWRLSYRNTSGTDRSGLRISLHFSF